MVSKSNQDSSDEKKNQTLIRKKTNFVKNLKRDTLKGNGAIEMDMFKELRINKMHI